MARVTYVKAARRAIADVARPALTEPGTIVVRQGTRQAPEVVSRLYKRSNYAGGPRRVRSIAWAVATSMRGQDMEANFYVVSRSINGHPVDDVLAVWNGIDCMLGHWPYSAVEG